jgi:hypothetical protein
MLDTASVLSNNGLANRLKEDRVITYRVPAHPFVILAACLAACCSTGDADRAVGIIRAEEQLELSDLWLGFAPLSVPVAVFDGERTFLARHPAPPQEFEPIRGNTGVWVYEGRHPALTACTSGEIGQVKTALVILGPGQGDRADKTAALLLHESFHVFAGAVHPDWGANEAEAFTYPVEDTPGLALRRLEIEALRRALAAVSDQEASHWAATVLDIRRKRFRRLKAGHAQYERGIELVEGTACYVENRSLRDAAAPPFREDAYGAAEIRRTGYDTGRALCMLLDRLAPGWKVRLGEGPTIPLDSLLTEAVTVRMARPYEISDDVVEAELSHAEREVAATVENREREREGFLGAEGWTLEVVADRMEDAFWSATFDPMNVTRFGPGEVLHKRMLTLSGTSGTFEAMDQQVLTEAAGEHPIFSGICRIVAAGLDSEPTIQEQEGKVTVEAEGITASLAVTSVERRERVITIHMR